MEARDHRNCRLKGEYGQWFDALAETLHDTPTREAVQAIVDLDPEELIAIQPPRGYGPRVGPEHDAVEHFEIIVPAELGQAQQAR